MRPSANSKDEVLVARELHASCNVFRSRTANDETRAFQHPAVPELGGSSITGIIRPKHPPADLRCKLPNRGRINLAYRPAGFPASPYGIHERLLGYWMLTECRDRGRNHSAPPEKFPAIDSQTHMTIILHKLDDQSIQDQRSVDDFVSDDDEVVAGEKLITCVFP